MNQLTDSALMLKVKSGDLKKMGLLYERHKKRLFGFFYNMNGDAMTSEDLVQNVFIRMLKYKHTYSGDGAFLAWMFRTARNVNSDYFRKNKNNNQQYDIASVAFKLESKDDFEDDLEIKDNIRHLNMALGKLPYEKREVLVLSKLKEMKFSEIGEVLGCSEGAAKVKAHRALKDLRTVFLQLETR